jgi:hypothetical protein
LGNSLVSALNLKKKKKKKKKKRERERESIGATTCGIYQSDFNYLGLDIAYMTTVY